MSSCWEIDFTQRRRGAEMAAGWRLAAPCRPRRSGVSFTRRSGESNFTQRRKDAKGLGMVAGRRSPACSSSLLGRVFHAEAQRRRDGGGMEAGRALSRRPRRARGSLIWRAERRLAVRSPPSSPWARPCPCPCPCPRGGGQSEIPAQQSGRGVSPSRRPLVPAPLRLCAKKIVARVRRSSGRADESQIRERSARRASDRSRRWSLVDRRARSLRRGCSRGRRSRRRGRWCRCGRCRSRRSSRCS